MYKVVAIGVVVLGVGGLVLSGLLRNDSAPQTVLSTQNSAISTTDTSMMPEISACEALTLALAESILGPGARQLQSAVGEEVTVDRALTDCVYDEGTESLTGKTASLVSRRALTVDGAQLNKAEMEETALQGLVEGEEATTATVAGLGDAAVWNQDFGQLNVLLDEGGYWLTIQIGVGGVDADKAATVELATMIVESYEQ